MEISELSEEEKEDSELRENAGHSNGFETSLEEGRGGDVVAEPEDQEEEEEEGGEMEMKSVEGDQDDGPAPERVEKKVEPHLYRFEWTDATASTALQAFIAGRDAIFAAQRQSPPAEEEAAALEILTGKKASLGDATARSYLHCFARYLVFCRIAQVSPFPVTAGMTILFLHQQKMKFPTKTPNLGVCFKACRCFARCTFSIFNPKSDRDEYEPWKDSKYLAVELVPGVDYSSESRPRRDQKRKAPSKKKRNRDSHSPECLPANSPSLFDQSTNPLGLKPTARRTLNSLSTLELADLVSAPDSNDVQGSLASSSRVEEPVPHDPNLAELSPRPLSKRRTKATRNRVPSSAVDDDFYSSPDLPPLPSLPAVEPSSPHLVTFLRSLDPALSTLAPFLDDAGYTTLDSLVEFCSLSSRTRQLVYSCIQEKGGGTIDSSLFETLERKLVEAEESDWSLA
ncbi:uncharacterized protein JCM6883_002915 [Sporobolomyces salmoneus]|uniref:uncharacterized protein n=1 Tax=Sporobolomyces salmoneus TaxID=183962 RepID=UPI00316EF517